MSKQTVKIKHLGMFSTGKFMAVFNFILTLVVMGIGIVFGILFALVSVLVGIFSGDFNTLLVAITSAVGIVLTYLVTGLIVIVGYTIMGFIVGAIVAFCFNIVVKLSGGLSFDAEIA